MNLKTIFFIASFIWITGFIQAQTRQKDIMPFLRVESQRFVDTQNREVILNGINHVVKDPAQNYLYPDDEQLFQAFREYGFNCIRYGIIWDGLEPEPGVINEEYLQEIDKRVRWAEENGIWLVLDMHQDLFSRKFSDGAPIWATLDQEKPHQTGAIWSDAYLMSPAVQQAFDSFWQMRRQKMESAYRIIISKSGKCWQTVIRIRRLWPDSM